MTREEINKVTEKEIYSMDDLKAVCAYLRGDNGCPWDRVQTHESTRANLIEETYEVVEAIDTADSKLMREELGDLLLQVVFHSAMEEEEGRFDIYDVIHDVTDKLVRRHPHVFGDVDADDPEKAIDAWEAAKGVEKKDRKTVVDNMNAVPPSLPALMRAQKVLKKAIKGGYDATSDMKNGAASLRALADAIEGGEIVYNGSLAADSLLAICAYAQAAGADSEELLTKRVNGFIESYK